MHEGQLLKGIGLDDDLLVAGQPKFVVDGVGINGPGVVEIAHAGARPVVAVILNHANRRCKEQPLTAPGDFVNRGRGRVAIDLHPPADLDRGFVKIINIGQLGAIDLGVAVVLVPLGGNQRLKGIAFLNTIVAITRKLPAPAVEIVNTVLGAEPDAIVGSDIDRVHFAFEFSDEWCPDNFAGLEARVGSDGGLGLRNIRHFDRSHRRRIDFRKGRVRNRRQTVGDCRIRLRRVVITAQGSHDIFRQIRLYLHLGFRLIHDRINPATAGLGIDFEILVEIVLLFQGAAKKSEFLGDLLRGIIQGHRVLHIVGPVVTVPVVKFVIDSHPDITGGAGTDGRDRSIGNFILAHYGRQAVVVKTGQPVHRADVNLRTVGRQTVDSIGRQSLRHRQCLPSLTVVGHQAAIGADEDIVAGGGDRRRCAGKINVIGYDQLFGDKPRPRFLDGDTDTIDLNFGENAVLQALAQVIHDIAEPVPVDTALVKRNQERIEHVHCRLPGRIIIGDMVNHRGAEVLEVFIAELVIGNGYLLDDRGQALFIAYVEIGSND